MRGREALTVSPHTPRFVAVGICGVLPRSVPPAPSPSPLNIPVSRLNEHRAEVVTGLGFVVGVRRHRARTTRCRRGAYGRCVNASCASDAWGGRGVDASAPWSRRVSDRRHRVDTSWLRVGWRRTVREGKTGMRKETGKKREKTNQLTVSPCCRGSHLAVAVDGLSGALDVVARREWVDAPWPCVDASRGSVLDVWCHRWHRRIARVVASTRCMVEASVNGVLSRRLQWLW